MRVDERREVGTLRAIKMAASTGLQYNIVQVQQVLGGRGANSDSQNKFRNITLLFSKKSEKKSKKFFLGGEGGNKPTVGDRAKHNLITVPHLKSTLIYIYFLSICMQNNTRLQ